MSEPFTDEDMRTQVKAAIPTFARYDVEKIVEDLQAEYGTVPIDSIPEGPFWDVVKANEIAVSLDEVLDDMARARTAPDHED